MGVLQGEPSTEPLPAQLTRIGDRAEASGDAPALLVLALVARAQGIEDPGPPLLRTAGRRRERRADLPGAVCGRSGRAPARLLRTPSCSIE